VFELESNAEAALAEVTAAWADALVTPELKSLSDSEPKTIEFTNASATTLLDEKVIEPLAGVMVKDSSISVLLSMAEALALGVVASIRSTTASINANDIIGRRSKVTVLLMAISYLSEGRSGSCCQSRATFQSGVDLQRIS